MTKRLAHIGTWLRQGLPALALYALVLQAFLAGAAPVAAFNPETAPLCAEMASGTHVPDQNKAHPDCLCLAQCLQAHAQAGLTPSGDNLAPPRDAQVLVHHVPAGLAGLSRPAERAHGARAPPQA